MRSDDYPPASYEAFEGLANYLLLKRLDAKPDTMLLCRGLPHGGLLSAVPRDDGAFDIVIRDQQQPDKARNPRSVDAEELLVIRLFLLANSHICLSRTDKEPRPVKHYPTLFTNQIKLLRILADAQPGEKVRQRDDHHILRRGSLFKVAALPSETMGRTWKGRELAIATAIASFRERDMTHLPIDDADYEKIMRAALSFLDQLPLAKLPE